MSGARPGPLVVLAAIGCVALAAGACTKAPRPSIATLPPVSGQPAPGWNRLAAGPEALSEVAATEHGGRIWVAGGLSGNGRASDRVHVLDLSILTWSEGPRLPEPVHHAVLVSDGESLWLLGGYVGDNFSRPTDAVRLLEPDATAWTDGPPLPVPRAAGAAAFNGVGRIVYGGGVGPDGRMEEVFALEEHGWLRLAPLSGGREHLAAASDGAGRVFFLGGRRGGLGGNLATVDVVDLVSTGKLGDLPTPRGGVAAFWTPAVGACLVGGESPGGTNREVECIDWDRHQTRLPDLGVGRHGLGAAVVGGRVYVLLGGEEPGLFVSDVVETLELP